MMLCRAGFVELFPEMFEPQVSATPAAPSDDCVARWEDDGGAPAPVVWKRSKSWRGYAAHGRSPSRASRSTFRHAVEQGGDAAGPAHTGCGGNTLTEQ